jgi:hypothetical protein
VITRIFVWSSRSILKQSSGLNSYKVPRSSRVADAGEGVQKTYLHLDTAEIAPVVRCVHQPVFRHATMVGHGTDGTRLKIESLLADIEVKLFVMNDWIQFFPRFPRLPDRVGKRLLQVEAWNMVLHKRSFRKIRFQRRKSSFGDVFRVGGTDAIRHMSCSG